MYFRPQVWRHLGFSRQVLALSIREARQLCGIKGGESRLLVLALDFLFFRPAYLFLRIKLKPRYARYEHS